MSGAPELPALLVGHWVVSWPLTGEAGAGAGLYVWAAQRIRTRWPWWRTAAFLTGVGAVLVALQSGLDTYDDQLLSVHMVQHLVLLQVAPVLLLLGRPLRLTLRVLPPAGARRVSRRMARARPFSGPVVCLIVFTVVVLGTHVPTFYDATLRHPALHDAEHALYLAAGLLLWWPLLGDDPAARRRLNGVVALVYVIAAMVPMEAVGAYLSRQPTLVYAAYALPGRSLGVPAVLDQQHAGAIMWVAGGVVMTFVGLAVAIHALLEDERRQRARDVREMTAIAGTGAPR